jgi:hypothetical protein
VFVSEDETPSVVRSAHIIFIVMEIHASAYQFVVDISFDIFAVRAPYRVEKVETLSRSGKLPPPKTTVPAFGRCCGGENEDDAKNHCCIWL